MRTEGERGGKVRRGEDRGREEERGGREGRGEDIGKEWREEWRVVFMYYLRTYTYIIKPCINNNHAESKQYH